MAWVSASMPVPAVTPAGRLTLSAGSMRATQAAMFGVPPTLNFTLRSGSVITAQSVTSLPVPRRCWDGDERRDPRVDGILAPLVLTDAAAVDSHDAYALGAVDRAAAADRHQAVAALRLVVAGAGVDQGNPWVGPDLVVGDRVQLGRAH